MSNQPDISIVIPLYNEEKVFPKLVQELDRVMGLRDDISFEVVLVDDGSKDSTRKQMTQQSLDDNRYISIFLSRNFGHQIAVSAGLSYANCAKACFIIDGDLQDPPQLVFDFYEKLQEGYDVVYGVRKKRKESIFKRAAYNAFYRILSSISTINLPLDSGDFSMISTRVKDTMIAMPEESRYLRGMRAWVGYKQYPYEYERSSREDGESKYTLSMLVKLAYNGIFNFSTFPIKFVTYLGGIFLLMSSLYIGFTIFNKVVYDSNPSGFTALASLIFLFGSMQLIAIGVIGEYVVRIFFQSKNRPLFIVDKVIKNKEISNG